MIRNTRKQLSKSSPCKGIMTDASRQSLPCLIWMCNSLVNSLFANFTHNAKTLSTKLSEITNSISSKNTSIKSSIKSSKANSTLLSRHSIIVRSDAIWSLLTLINKRPLNPGSPVSKRLFLKSKASISSKTNHPKRNCANPSGTLIWKKLKNLLSQSPDSKNNDNHIKSMALSAHQLPSKVSPTKKKSNFSRKAPNLQHFCWKNAKNLVPKWSQCHHLPPKKTKKTGFPHPTKPKTL